MENNVKIGNNNKINKSKIGTNEYNNKGRNLLKWILPLTLAIICSILSILSYKLDNQTFTLSKDIALSCSIPLSITFAITFNVTKIGQVVVNEEKKKELNENDKEIYKKLDKNISLLTRAINEETQYSDLTHSTIYDDVERLLEQINENRPLYIFKDPQLNDKFLELYSNCNNLLSAVHKIKSTKIMFSFEYHIYDKSTYEKVKSDIEINISDFRSIYRNKCD